MYLLFIHRIDQRSQRDDDQHDRLCHSDQVLIAYSGFEHLEHTLSHDTSGCCSTASPVAVRTLSFADFARMFLYTETTDMASTVQPDRKLMLLTLMTPTASSTGLIMTPPPIPQIDPAIDDRILTAKK